MLCLPLVLFIRMALNAIDGMLAREFGQKSTLGGILNELGDVVSDAALYLPLAMHPAITPQLVVAFVLLALLAESAGVCAAVAGAGRRYEGPMGKSDRAPAFGAVGFLAGTGVPLRPWIDWAIGLCAVLAVVTILNRIRASLQAAGASGCGRPRP